MKRLRPSAQGIKDIVMAKKTPARAAVSEKARGIAKESLQQRDKERLQRRHRQVIYLNDDEWAAVRLYAEKFKVGSRSALFRESVLMRIMSVLDDCQPTLF